MDAVQGDDIAALMRPRGEGMTIRIGGEIGVSALRGCTMITAPYLVGQGHAGSIAVIGPTRMAYDYTIAVLETVSAELTRLLKVEEEAL